MARGRFITLEGGEGVGKSTLARTLRDRLSMAGRDVVLTREPGGSPGAEHLRGVILNPPEDLGWRPLSETLLFYAARVEHLDALIRPALARGQWVICDRFSDSTRAYQTASDPDIATKIETLDALCVGDSQPDLTLVLDLPLDEGRRRLKTRGSTGDAIEDRDSAYHQRVREAFLEIAKRNSQRCVVLDASLAPDALAAVAMQQIAKRLAVAADDS